MFCEKGRLLHFCNDKILDWSKFKAHADNKISVAQNWNFFNPVPDMPILGSSNSAANKDMMEKYGQMVIQFSA